MQSSGWCSSRRSGPAPSISWRASCRRPPAMRPDATVAEVRRRLAAPPERVVGALADAGLVSRWLSPSPDVVLTVLDFDFRVGGAYRFAYAIPGGATMHVNGVFRTIEQP